MRRHWVLWLVLSLLGCEALTCWLNASGTTFAKIEPYYRAFHLLQMAALIVLAYLSYRVIAGGRLWSKIRKLVLAGLCFSFAGDVINSFLIDLSFIVQPQTLLSAIPFAAAHFLYIGAFWQLGRAGRHPVQGPAITLTLLCWPLLSAGLWTLLVDTSTGPLLKWLSFAYAHMVVLMALTSLWPLRAWGRVAWVTAVGGFVFLLSDAFFGAWLTEGQSRPLWVSQFIWVTYFLAQLCIAHVPLVVLRQAAKADIDMRMPAREAGA